MPLTTFSKNFTGSTKDSRSVTQAEAEDYQPRLIRSTYSIRTLQSRTRLTTHAVLVKQSIDVLSR